MRFARRGGRRGEDTCGVPFRPLESMSRTFAERSVRSDYIRQAPKASLGLSEEVDCESSARSSSEANQDVVFPGYSVSCNVERWLSRAVQYWR